MRVIDTLGPALGYILATSPQRVGDAMQDGARELEAYAKQNAPWTDQTGAARNGLFADVDDDGGVIVIELGHTVDYGIWLELIQDGTYAIIMPTLEALGPDILDKAGAQMIAGPGVIF